jgi:hypothetical protein
MAAHEPVGVVSKALIGLLLLKKANYPSRPKLVMAFCHFAYSWERQHAFGPQVSPDLYPLSIPV